MICQELAIRQILSRHHELLTDDAAKVQVVIFFRLVLTEGGGKTYGVVVWREGYKAFVEGLIVEGRQTDAIAGIKAVFFVRLVRPGDDVASQQ